jgi:hypothetical protein
MNNGSQVRVIWVISLCIAAAIFLNGLFTVWSIRNYQNAQQAQGVIIDRKLCADVSTMSNIKPPAGPPSTNPSRAYEQAEHRAWSGLRDALGCK